MAPRPLRRPGLRRSLGVVVASVVAVGLLASCSSDDGGSSDGAIALESSTSVVATTAAPVEPGTAAEYAAALTGSLQADPNTVPLMDDDQATCVGPKWVEAITPARFGTAGLTPADVEGEVWTRTISSLALTVDEAGPLVDALGACGVDVRRTMIDSARTSNGSELDADAVACLEEELTTDLAERFAAVGLSGAASDPVATDVSGQYLTVLQDCGLYSAG
ncbi:MAG: hypothetical protein KF906_08245 [Actinobacteria bacterium]|nr:hypothetical protein [Actinomycetota bacterium]